MNKHVTRTAVARLVGFLSRLSGPWVRLKKRDPRYPGSPEMQTIYQIRGKVACPRCGSTIGFDCRTPGGRRVRMLHDERVLVGLNVRAGRR